MCIVLHYISAVVKKVYKTMVICTLFYQCLLLTLNCALVFLSVSSARELNPAKMY